MNNADKVINPEEDYQRQVSELIKAMQVNENEQ